MQVDGCQAYRSGESFGPRPVARRPSVCGAQCPDVRAQKPRGPRTAGHFRENRLSKSSFYRLAVGRINQYRHRSSSRDSVDRPAGWMVEQQCLYASCTWPSRSSSVQKVDRPRSACKHHAVDENIVYCTSGLGHAAEKHILSASASLPRTALGTAWVERLGGA